MSTCITVRKKKKKTTEKAPLKTIWPQSVNNSYKQIVNIWDMK